VSGIVSLFDRGLGIDPSERTETMLETIDHRGPDGTGRWYDDRVGIGYQHLETTPESRFDEQPHACDGVVLAGDVRIDNREELREQVPLPDDDGPVTDSEFVLAAYRRWGTQCVDHLVGAFAFVVWDRERERLFCARDHFGVKPLYYHHSDGVFALGTEQKALLALPFVPGTLDEVKIGDFLTGNFADKERTHYESIKRLPPAHAMTVEVSGVERWQYWDLDPTRTIELESDAAYERTFRELFEQAVECRLRSVSPVGTSLSGGLDSSSITVTARELLPNDESLHTFSNVYDEAPSADEREFIETVTEREGIESHYVFCDEVGVLPDRETLFEYYDQPPHNTMEFAIWERVKRANQIGVGVAMEGALGDSVGNHGFGLLPELLRKGRLWHLLRELRGMGEVWGVPVRRIFIQNALSPLIPPEVKWKYDEFRGRPILEQAANPTLTPSFIECVDLRERYKKDSSKGPLFRQTARGWQRRSLLAGRVPAAFETSDQLHAAFGVEPRFPFADKRLVEFSLAIPVSQQLSDGWTRAILRRSLADLLPEKVRTRPWKTAMNEAFWNALHNDTELLTAQIDDLGRLSRYVDSELLQNAYDRFKKEATTETPDARVLWYAVSLSTWLENSRPGDLNG